ncbi:sigma-70 family RNA polymerase sigma factor [uncultured Eubacterium sp.]|mgnify:CR=1 FL=1|uniref:sigma-70 family RNA polymerase sigma factor n=1 Tax=uncultured Eubacterium sp. TaxID=165185 RepID=UPI00261B02E8|nr:sigma-70 family RNA polymerase sigma factor [uncultured Eubacterium sp.]
MILFLEYLNTEQERENFKKLYRQYKNLLFWIARSKTNSDEDAEDCVQETFAYVAKHFDKIDCIESNRTKCYLATIVEGFAIDIYNKVQKESDINFSSSLSTDNNFGEYNKIELLSVFEKTLNEEDKVYFYLKYIYGYSSSEIAEIYDVKDTYIRKRLQYSKEKMRKALKGTEGLY